MKVELTTEQLESLLDEVQLRQIDEHTYERMNEEFNFETKRKPDEVFFNIAVGGMFVYLFLGWVNAFS